MKPSKKWAKMAEIYKLFSDHHENIDFSNQALQEMFEYETFGKGDLRLNIFANKNGKFNGYAVGKHWMDVTIAMWKEDIKEGLLFKFELKKEYPEWFLEKVGVLSIPQGNIFYKNYMERIENGQTQGQ